MRAGPTHTAGMRLRTPSLRRRVTLVVLLLMSAMLALLVVTTDLVLRNRLEAQLEQRLVDRAELGVSLGGQLAPADLAKQLEGNGISVLLVASNGQTYAEGPPPGKPAPGSGGARPAPPPPAATSQPQVSRDGNVLQVSRAVGDGASLLLSADASEGFARSSRSAWPSSRERSSSSSSPRWSWARWSAARYSRWSGSPRWPGRSGEATGAPACAPTAPGPSWGRRRTRSTRCSTRWRGPSGWPWTPNSGCATSCPTPPTSSRTPIAGLRAAGEHLLRADPPREKREATLQTLVRESQRASRLVDDLLVMARIDRGLALETADVDLSHVTRTVVDARRLRRPDTRLVMTGDPVVVDGDADRLAQVVGNLVDNAVRAAGPGGAVHVDVRGEGRSACVEVTDDGPGIAPGDRERVFERLVRLVDGRSGGDGGAGLGLPIARGIARAHGGDLVVVDAGHGGGARFRFTLPAHSLVVPTPR